MAAKRAGRKPAAGRPGGRSGTRQTEPLTGRTPAAQAPAAAEVSAAPPPVATPEPPRNEPPRRLRQRLRKMALPSWKWLAGVFSAVAVGVITPTVLAMVQPQPGPPVPVQTATADTDPLLFVATVAPNVGDCSVTNEWITKNVAAEPAYQGGQEAAPADGVLASGGWLGITLQAAAGKTVVLESASVQVVGRQLPVAGILLGHGTGCGELRPRYFALDLDARNPVLVPYSGDTAGRNISAARFPFTIGEQDPELFLVRANATLSAYSFRLELNWVSDGRSGTTTVDDHGRPFFVSSVSRAAVYCADPASGVWRPSSSGQCQ